jgi:hypothetical protein
MRAATDGALLPLVVLLLSGCGGTPAVPGDRLSPTGELVLGSERDRVTATIRAEGGRIVEGHNTFLVTTDPASAEVVSGDVFMPVHGHGSIEPVISRLVDAYRVDAVCTMPGIWNVALDLAVAGDADRVVFSVDVP